MESKVKEIITHYQQVIEQASGDKYNRPGVYCIFINNNLVYVGRSSNMLVRISNHMYQIDVNQKTNKYIQIRRARDNDCKIRFDVLAYCSEDECPYQEAYWINKLKPALNTQIPKLDNPASFEYNKRAKTITYEEILGQPV